MSYAAEYDRLLHLRHLGVITDLEAEALLAPYAKLNFGYAAIEKEITMAKFKVGDKVRLKDSPYKGTIEVAAAPFARFRMADGNSITTSDYKVLEYDIDPQPGDIYEDKNGHEWVVVKQRGWSYHPEDMIAARLISYTEEPGYDHSTLALSKPENVVNWADRYEPKLVRRRGA